MDKSVLWMISYGMYVIGVYDDILLRPTGCIINTVSQVTSENPIISLSINKNNYSYEVIRRTNKFSISIISEKTNPKVIQKLGFLSGKDKYKLEGIDFTLAQNLPLINENCCGHIICDVISMVETSTHFVILASVKELVKGFDGVPMTYKYYHEVIKGSAPKNAPSYQGEQKKTNQTPKNYTCDVCGYVYEGDVTSEPEDYICPICGASKEHFLN